MSFICTIEWSSVQCERAHEFSNSTFFALLVFHTTPRSVQRYHRIRSIDDSCVLRE